MGRKKKPLYAIVASDSRTPRDGRFIEDLGRYHATEEPAFVEINAERVNYWLDQGAKPTDTVRTLLKNNGVLLERHLTKGGKSPEQIAETIDGWKSERAAKARPAKLTAADRARLVLEEERKRADAQAAALAKAREEAEARAKTEAAAKARAEAEAAAAAREQAAAAEPAEEAEGGEEEAS